MVSIQNCPPSSEHRNLRGSLGQTANAIKVACSVVLQRGILQRETETVGRRSWVLEDQLHQGSSEKCGEAFNAQG